MSKREANWVGHSKAYLEESKIDLVAARLMKGSTTAGIDRRRLYFLQQSLEKAVKSYMPFLVLGFRSTTRMAAYRMEFDEGENIDQRALTILRVRIERFAHRITNEKDLSHNPAEKLQLRPFVEDLYLYLQLMKLPKDEIAIMYHAIESFEEKGVSEVLSRINRAEHDLSVLADQSVKRLEKEKTRARSVMEFIQVADEVIFPNYLSYAVMIVLYISLLSKLAEYEQAFRYPDQNKIPDQILGNIDAIEIRVDKFVGWLDQFFANDKLLTLLNKMYFKQGTSRVSG